jgi:peptide deformylase
LSFPGEILKVKRPQEIMVEYININNKRTVKALKGFIAHIVSHEIDHLRGITFYDKLNEQKRRENNVN